MECAHPGLLRGVCSPGPPSWSVLLSGPPSWSVLLSGPPSGSVLSPGPPSWSELNGSILPRRRKNHRPARPKERPASRIQDQRTPRLDPGETKLPWRLIPWDLPPIQRVNQTPRYLQHTTGTQTTPTRPKVDVSVQAKTSGGSDDSWPSTPSGKPRTPRAPKKKTQSHSARVQLKPQDLYAEFVASINEGQPSL